jgi:CheY-like chemotaxis protein
MTFGPKGDDRQDALQSLSLTTGAPPQTSIDWEQLEVMLSRTADGGVTLAEQLVTRFVHEAPVAVRNIRAALRSLRALEVAREAQRLHELARALGATSVAALSSDIGNMGRTGTLMPVAERLRLLEFEVTVSVRLYSDALRTFPNRTLVDTLGATGTEPQGGTGGDLHGKKVLVADHNVLNRLAAREILSAAGAEVIEAMSVSCLVQQIEQGHVDLVLMNAQMSAGDGLEAVQRLRSLRNEQHRSVPVIAIAASPRTGDGTPLVPHGCQAIRCEPLTQESLLNAIQVVLLKNRATCETSVSLQDAAVSPVSNRDGE